MPSKGLLPNIIMENNIDCDSFNDIVQLPCPLKDAKSCDIDESAPGYIVKYGREREEKIVIVELKAHELILTQCHCIKAFISLAPYKPYFKPKVGLTMQ